MIQDYYNKVTGKNITSGLVLSHQTAGDFARPNPHWHGLLLEGGFNDEGNFVYLPISSTKDMTELFKELVQQFANNVLKRSALERYVKTSETAAKMVLSNLRRAYELIRSFKKIAVDQSSEVRRQFNVKEYVNEILLSLQPKIKKTSHTITIHCPDNLVMDSFPGPFSQVVTNLVMNSLIHAYDKNDKGNILFDFTTKNNSLVLKYSDDGKGIQESHLERIFDPFFTTKRNQGGTGLGLHLLYNIVTQTFDGTIKCQSKPGAGTTFTIIFPHCK